MGDKRTPRTGGKRAVQRRGPGPALLALGVILLLLAVVFWSKGQEEPTPQPPAPATFQYRDRTMTALEGVPVNGYDPAGFLPDGTGRITYPGARQGIDVSVYQKEIDWQAAAGDGVDFAIIRLGYRGYTEGGLNLDSRFEENYAGARNAGVEVGVYFFSQATTPEEAEAEAEFVLAALEGRPLDYPVVFDWEFIAPGKGARTDSMDGETLTRCVRAFCDRIALGGYRPMVYFNQDLAYLTLDLGELADIPFWLAEYDDSPDFYYHFDLWQYTHTGTAAGIEGAVDWNLDLRSVK